MIKKIASECRKKLVECAKPNEKYAVWTTNKWNTYELMQAWAKHVQNIYGIIYVTTQSIKAHFTYNMIYLFTFCI